MAFRRNENHAHSEISTVVSSDRDLTMVDIAVFDRKRVLGEGHRQPERGRSEHDVETISFGRDAAHDRLRRQFSVEEVVRGRRAESCGSRAAPRR